jgi:1-acyl-sn-glycerol-3-phosphate acyltransferase
MAAQEPLLIKPPLDTRRRGQRLSSSRELAPDLDADSDLDADIAPIGPTEAASSRPEASSIREPVATPREAAPTPSPEEIEHQIQDLEARLDRMIRQSRQSRADAVPPPPPPMPSRPARPPQPEASQDEADADSVTARELLTTDFYLRQWGRIGMRNRSEEVDEFGLDPKYEARYRPFFDFLYKYYFRVDTEGTENIPAEDRCLIVSNHSGGALPYDGIMLRTTVRLEHPKARELRWLAEDFIYYLPFVGAAMNRIGAVRACQENAERLLAGGRLVAVFPEGAKGTGKLYRERYKLQRFGRGGFIRLCLRTQTPLVPCAIIGAEEANPMLYRIEYMTKALGIPYIPITPTFPALGPLGLLPAPTKWKIRFGEPISFDGYGPEAADDEILVGRLAERVRSTIQGLIDKALGSRRSIWFG